MRRSLALAALLLAALPAAAHAATPAAVFGLRGVPNPKLGYFVYTLGKGATKTGAVLVTNTGKAAGTVRLYAADGTTGQTTGTVYLTDKKPKRAGAWIRLESSSLTLKPGAHQLVHFTVRVPAGAPAGQWVGGLVAESTHLEKGQKTNRKASVQVNVRSQTIVAVQVNIPGKTAAKFTVGKITAGGSRGFQQVLIRVSNVGNALAKPTGTIAIKDKDGNVIQTIDFQMDTFLPQTSVDYPVVLKKALAAGSYSADVKLDYPGSAGTETVTSSPQFAVSKQNVEQVFTSSNPTQAPPGATASPSSSGGGGSSSTLLIAAIAIGGLIVILLAALLFTRRKPSN